MKQINFKFKKRRISVKAKECNGVERFFGLTFCRREKARALLFDFKKPVKIAIHSVHVFFPFIAIWLDKDDKVIAIRRVTPYNFYISPKKFYYRIIEIPINKKYSKIVQLLVGN